jgi:hypothetical protein
MYRDFQPSMHQKIGPFNLRMPARLISIYFSKMKKGKEKERRRRRLRVFGW